MVRTDMVGGRAGRRTRGAARLASTVALAVMVVGWPSTFAAQTQSESRQPPKFSGPSSQSLHQLWNDYWEWRLVEEPELATSVGRPHVNDRWRDLSKAARERAGRAYYPKLLVAVPFTPCPGRRLLGDDRNALLASLETIAIQNGLSSAHINFLAEDEVAAAKARGWLQRKGLQFHWFNRGYQDFDAYLAQLDQPKRKKIRAERRKVRPQVREQPRVHPRGAERLGLLQAASADAVVDPGVRVEPLDVRHEVLARRRLEEVDAGLEAVRRAERL